MKITFSDNYPNSLPAVDLVENKYESILIDKSLIQNFNNEIVRWKEVEKSNTYDNNNGMLEKLIANLMKIISNARALLE
jgi:hypothetical protein